MWQQGHDMKKHSAAWMLAASLLAWTALGIGDTAAVASDATAPHEPRLDLAAALAALGPHPSLGEQANIFGRLVGSWDVDYTDFSKDGKVSHRSGEFIVGWVMDGRAIQDVWIVDPSGGRKDREVYTEVRYFDPKSETWHATFIDPEDASVARFTGGAVGSDRIVFESQDLDGTETRWSFNEIRPDSLVYREESSRDGGNSWRLTSEYHMQRQRVAAAP
jgi:hypothetical protein